ncbi:Cupredoxin [Spinellus fusiger]|nr:Cupredoxin [Spinellus fusiger]
MPHKSDRRCILVGEINGIRHYELNISYSYTNPDCYRRTSTLLVNHQLPGTTIQVNQGDRVRITVRNQMSPYHGAHNATHGGNPNDLAIHFHGIRQYSSVNADGVPFLTQKPIPPGGHFVHDFRVVNQAGTYFYHAHVGLEEETVFGAFIVYESDRARPFLEKPPGFSSTPRLQSGPFTYDDERIIALSEWWHKDRYTLERYMLGTDFIHLPDAESVLINGRTLYNPGKPSAQCGGYSVVPVESGKTYRLRIIGSSAFRTFGFGIAQHSLTIIEVDGELVKPHTVPFIEVASGQRMSVLLHADQPPTDYTIATVRRWAEDVDPYSNGRAILRYIPIKPILTLPEERVKFPGQLKPEWIWSELQPFYGVDPIVYRESTRTIILRSTDAKQEDGSTRWMINGVPFMDPKSFLLDDIQAKKRRSPYYSQLKGSRSAYDPELGTYPLAYYELVDIVIQSTHKRGELCRSHPWHTHGHSHWLLATGPGEYVEERDHDKRTIPNPLYKDVTMVYPSLDPSLEESNSTEPVGCGWSKIRLLADNPGLWAVHCHNTLHMMMGMMVVFEEAPELIVPYTLSST